jgi:hypothetical protein
MACRNIKFPDVNFGNLTHGCGRRKKERERERERERQKRRIAKRDGNAEAASSGRKCE